MTDDQVLNFYAELVRHYGSALPSFEHEPRQFAYYVKLYRYTKEKHEQDTADTRGA